MVHTQTPSRKKQMEWEEIRGSNNGNKTTNIAFNKTETEWTAAKRETDIMWDMDRANETPKQHNKCKKNRH